MKSPLRSRSVDNAARSAVDHPALEWLARCGFVMNGVMHLLIGWIAIRIALGSGGVFICHTKLSTQVTAGPASKEAPWLTTT